MLNTIVGMLSGGAPGTDYESIATVTVGSGGASSIDFTSIPATYTDLCLKFSVRTNRATITAELLRVDFNGSSSSQSSRLLEGSGTSVSSFSLSTTQVAVGTTSASTASTFSNGELYIPNYAGSANKSISADSVAENNATTGPLYLGAGLWSNTAAITSISLTSTISTTIQQYSTATLYGISKS
jgi:hypothetical protein